MGNQRWWENEEVAVWHAAAGSAWQMQGKPVVHTIRRAQLGTVVGAASVEAWGMVSQQKHKALCTVANQRDGASSLFCNIWPWRASQHNTHQ